MKTSPSSGSVVAAGEERAFAAWTLAIVLLFTVVAGWRLDAAPVSREAELRVLDVARQMDASGDWFVPRRGDEIRINKPPLGYWLVAGAGTLTGEVDVLAARWPSLAATAALVLVVMVTGRAVGGAAVGVLAGLFLGGMIRVQAQARIGTAEAVLALLTSLALLVFDRSHHGGRRVLPLFGLVLGLAVLAKATVALLVVGLPIAVHLALRGELRRALRPATLGWIAAALSLAAAWYAVILATVPGALGELYGALVLPLGVTSHQHGASHYEPWHTTAVHLLQGAFPAVLLVPVVVWRAVRTRLWAAAPSLRLAAVAVVSLFVAFTLIPMKQRHYMLPLLPALSLLLAESTVALMAAESTPARRLLRSWAALAALVAGGAVTIGAALWVAVVLDLGAVAGVAVALAGTAAVLTGVVLGRKGRRAPAVAAWSLAWGACMLLHNGSYDVWERQFKVGSMTTRPDFDGPHWVALRERHRVLRDRFEVDEEWLDRSRSAHSAESWAALAPFREPPDDG